MGRSFLLILLMAAAFVLARRELTPPKPLPASAPAAVFSAGRAMVDDRIIARTPHPIGSKANAAVRDYLVRRMQALGLSPQVQRTTVYLDEGTPAAPRLAGGTVENVIGVLPGRDPALPALILMAHYDSVPGSPGAADDAAGVITALETVRAIQAGGRTPARDIILVITDGEEAALLGAQAFFQQAPQAARAGFVINMEARGGGGRVNMFQTGEDNGATIDAFRRVTPRPQATSLAGFIYKHMPNDTDFTVSLANKRPGLNYAFIGRQFDYHSPSSTPANLDQGSVQDMGDQVLAAADQLAFAPTLPPRTPDVVYGTLLDRWLIAYPTEAGWLVLAVAALLGAIGAMRSARLGDFRWIDVGRGIAAMLYAVAGSAALLHFARKATGVGVGFLEQRPLLAQAGRFELALVLLGAGFLIYAAAEVGRGRRTALILPLAAGLACSLFGSFDLVGAVAGGAAAVLALAAFGRPAMAPGAWSGVLLTGLAVAIAAQIAAPTAAAPIAWPLLLGAAASALSAAGAHRGLLATLVVAAAALVGLTFAAVFTHNAYLGLDLPELLVLPFVMALLVAFPLAAPHPDSSHGHGLAVLMIFVGLCLIAWVHYLASWSTRRPQATEVAYVQDLDHGRAWRVDLMPTLDPWSQGVLAADGGAVERRRFPPYASWHVRAAPAASVAAAPAVLSVTRAKDGAVQITATPPPSARELFLELRPAGPTGPLTLDGRSTHVTLPPGKWTPLHAYAAPQGVVIGLRPSGPGAMDVRWAAQTEQWPLAAKPLPQRPPKVMAWDLSDSTVAIGSQHLIW